MVGLTGSDGLPEQGSEVHFVLGSPVSPERGQS
jgi:hypothetical protein